MTQDSALALLRHSLAVLAYRGGKALRGAPPGFAGFRAGATTRTPAEILAHVGDLLDWALHMAQGREVWKETPSHGWDRDVDRFFAGVATLDAFLAAAKPMECEPGRLFQGPIADALTHVGQLTMLRRLAGAPVRGENYSRAAIEVGRVGPDQAAPRREFD